MISTREQVLAALRERIVGYAASHIGKDFAEDLAQETLIVIERKYGQVERAEELLPLAFQILRFKMTEFRRKAARRGEFDSKPVEDIALSDGAADHALALERRDLQEKLAAAIEKLDGRCRELMRLKLEDKGFEEIRVALGAATLNTVYTWDHRCRQRLRELMGGVR